MIAAKPLWIRFDKIDGFISIFERTRYLVLILSETYDIIDSRIRYLVWEKTLLSNLIKVDSYDSLTFDNVMTLTNSVWSKAQKHYYMIYS